MTLLLTKTVMDTLSGATSIHSTNHTILVSKTIVDAKKEPPPKDHRLKVVDSMMVVPKIIDSMVDFILNGSKIGS